MSDFVSGSGFFSKKPKKPKVAEITAISNDRAEVVLGVCEGQVEGLGAFPARNILLDGTPIENVDGSKNFEGLNFAFYSGTISQPPLPGNSGGQISTPTNVGVEILKLSPASRTITNNSGINAIRVRVGVRLEKQDSGGNISGESLTIRIFVKEGGGAFVLRQEQTITGRYATYTVFPYELSVNSLVSHFTVRIEKAAEDSQGSVVRDLQWLTYEEVINAQVEYANTAILWVQYPPNLFDSAPTVTLRLAGWLAQIPSTSNINLVDRGLDFINIGWNGTFYKSGLANTCPAWLLWAYLTDSVWGLGIDPQYIDRYAFYEASIYNNQMVSDGFGGVERRFTFRGQITVGGDGEDRFQTAREIAASFSAKIYHNGLQYTIWQDRPTSASPRIISNADVVDGIFLGTTQEFNAIATACLVWRKDPEQNFEETPEPVEYPSAINRFGYKVEEFRALGETRRGGALRSGRRVILSSLPSATKGEIGQISFKMRAFGLFFELGEVVQVADSGRNPSRKSGLIKSATSSTIELDAPVSIQSGAKIYCILPNMNTEARDLVQSAGTYSIVSVSVPFSQAPQAQATWQIVDSSTIVRSYRIISIAPDTDNQNLHEITAKLYNEERYSEIESNWILTAYNAISKPPLIVPTIRNLLAVPRIVFTEAAILYKLESRWDYPIRSDGNKETYVNNYIAEFKSGINGTWGNRLIIDTEIALWEFLNPGTFYVRVAAQAIDGKVSAWVESNSALLSPEITVNSAWLLSILQEDELM